MKNEFDIFQDDIKVPNIVLQREEEAFARIQKEGGTRISRKTAQKRMPFFRVAAAALCVLAVCVVTGVGVNAATGGAFFDSVRAFVGLPQQQKKVADESIRIGRTDIQVYADPLEACSDAYLVFANERGLMIYGRKEQTVLAALDLQALDCNYFYADTITTHVMMQADTLYIFNEYADRDTAEVYLYDLTQTGQEQALGRVDDAGEIRKIKKQWNRYAKDHCRKTFDTVQKAQEDWNGAADLRYSEECIVWTDARGEEMISCLLVHGDGSYQLYTYPKDAPENVTMETLNLESQTEDAAEEGLPAFVYTGDDPIQKTLCEYMCAQDLGYDTKGVVYIPAPVIYQIVEEDDGVTVFANLWSFTYIQNGNALNNESGGEQPSRLKLKADGNGGYTVVEHLTAGDGSDYAKDIEEFCKGYPVSADEFMQAGQEFQEIRKELVKMYVDDNHLPIRYIKDYGWDPIPIDDKEE